MSKDKFPSFSAYDFIRLYCALNVKNGQLPILVHHELEKKLYHFYSIPEFKILFEDISSKNDYINDENNYLFLTSAFQTAQTFGLLILIQDVGELRSFISCDVNEAEQIINEYDKKMVSAMSSLCSMLLKFSDNNVNYDKVNIDSVTRHIKENISNDGKVYRMLQHPNAICDVKVTEESRKKLAKRLLK